MDRVIEHFKTICRIPHGSGNCLPISEHLLRFAEEHALAATRDAAGNVIIRKPASPGYEDAPAMILQGHVDMVCEKDADSTHDFSRDPLQLIQEDDWLFAKGTTLGGDDGIAVAYMLAILESGEIPHPALECVFTTDEETGMCGALALDYSALQGRIMINIDSEEEGVILAGCAGGMTLHTEIPIRRVQTPSLCWYRIGVRGLFGGHSGMEIGRGRANADILLGRLLFELSDAFTVALAEMAGGTKGNAIPREAGMLLGVPSAEAALLPEFLNGRRDVYAQEYAGIEQTLQITCTPDGEGERSACDPASLAKLLLYLRALPDGVIKWSGTIEGLVETSCNLGILSLEESALCAVTNVRSSLESAKIALAEKICLLASFVGGNVETDEIYPAWEYIEDSPWRDKALSIYREVTGKDAQLKVLHAGLECGLFYEALPGLSCISIGPDILDVHTSRERMSLSSVARTYQYLLALLGAAKEF